MGINVGNQCFHAALKQNAAAAAPFRCRLSHSTKLLATLVSHLDGVGLPAVIILRFDLYLHRATGLGAQGVTALVLLQRAVCV